MSDAFNNYCIACDQLCSPNSVYCSDSCREQDQHQSTSNLTSHDIVLPLLTPMIYNNANASGQNESRVYTTTTNHELNNSPLLLSAEHNEQLEEDDVKDFSLNYSVSQQPPILGPLASTSHNYRLWLGVL